jgi:hypothetical protein
VACAQAERARSQVFAENAPSDELPSRHRNGTPIIVESGQGRLQRGMHRALHALDMNVQLVLAAGMLRVHGQAHGLARHGAAGLFGECLPSVPSRGKVVGCLGILQPLAFDAADRACRYQQEMCATLAVRQQRVAELRVALGDLDARAGQRGVGGKPMRQALGLHDFAQGVAVGRAHP